MVHGHGSLRRLTGQYRGLLDLASARGDLSQAARVRGRPGRSARELALGAVLYRLAVIAGHLILPGVTGKGDTVPSCPAPRSAPWRARRRRIRGVLQDDLI